MENVICTVVQEKTAEEFISVLNKYGVCTDYSNDYERSKAIQGIFVGVINKVYDVVWKGEGGHSEHDTLFISAKSLISSRRESQPFRVGFVGNIVSQLVEVNLKEGDAIGILKPKFFYALDIPTLCAGIGNVVVWVAKDLKDSELNEDVAKSSEEDQCCQSLIKKSNGTNNNRKRIPFIDEDSDTHSVGISSTSGISSIQHNIQIFRSRPVELKRPPEVSVNSKLVPDSTTRTVVQRCQNNICTENKSAPENVLAENLVSQNTANVGSIEDISCRNENQSKFICNLDSAVKSGHKDLCCSSHNVANNTCGMPSHIVSCKTNCCSSRVNCCNCHTPANHFKENCCRSSCACLNNQHCSCNINSCCGHNAMPQCMHWSSAHSCHTNNSSCNRHFDHHCISVKSCCGHCHSQKYQCCTPHCQNGCMKSKHFHRPTNLDKTSTLCCNKQVTTPIHCHNLCCCNHEKVSTSENRRVSHSSGCRNDSNSQHPKRDNSNEEMSIELSEDSHKKSRIKEWVHNWVGDPPHLLPDIEASGQSSSSQNPSLESRHNAVEDGKTCSNERESRLIFSNPSDCVSKKKTEKHIAKKKKLFTPLDNSTIISAKSVCCNSTIIEESTPFDSENHTDTVQKNGLSFDKNQKSEEPSVKVTINLPLSNNVGVDNTPNVILTDPLGAKDANNCTAFAKERLCPEKNAQESLIINQLQNKESLSRENRNSSEEQFPELRIETPIISQTCTESQSDVNRKEILNKTNQCELNMADYVKISCSKNNVNSNQQTKGSTAIEKMNSHIEEIDDGNNEQGSFQKASELPEKMACKGKNDLVVTNENNESNERNDVQVDTIIYKNNKDSCCHKSLALQDHSKSITSSKGEETDSRMDLTLINDETIEKEGMKRSKESSDDAMELTCESRLMKRRKKEKFRKTRSVGSLSSGRNTTNDFSVSSKGSFYDARSDGILSLKSNKWCLKPIKEIFEKSHFPLSQKAIERLSLHNGSSYNLNLFSTFNVLGAIINIIPNLSAENFGNIVIGFCNEGCKKECRYDDYKEMEPLSPECTFCRYNYHVACPRCSKAGSKHPLCLYYTFEIHLFDGENVLRVEIDHKSGVNFLGSTPQVYLKSGNLYKKINKIIFPISHDKWVNPILLKAKIKVLPKSGASVLTLEDTCLRKDLTFKGKHYKL